MPQTFPNQFHNNLLTAEETWSNQSGGLDRETILSTAVQKARQALAVDRIVVYSLDQQSQGQIIAESVDARYPQALGAIIDDPCMSAHYLEKYQNGRVRAIDDIEQANLTECHLAQLKPFAVKANLVAPILTQGQIMGLLIAHHCAAPHAWQTSEIETMVKMAQQLGLVLDNANLVINSARFQQQKAAETQRIQSLTKATEKIRTSLDREEMFQTAVTETRQIIAADRVVVYSLDPQSKGQIIAESVDGSYPQALRKIIDDPCMSAHYLEKYQNGRVRAIDDIEQANLTECHLAQLEAFAVKANLVVPILSRRKIKIIGLLIAHHCAAPHAWEPSEIDVMLQIANQIGSALDYLQLLKTSLRLQQQQEAETQRIQSLTKATEKIHTSLEGEEILPTAVAEARQIIAADRVVVYSLDQQSQGKIIAESVDARYPQALGALIDDPCMSANYLEKYQNGRVQAVDDIEQANLTPCHLAQLKPFAVKANLVAPILTQGKIIGLLIAHHCAAPHAWQPSEISVIVQIAQQIGWSIDHSHLLTEVAQVSQAFLKQLPAVADLAQVVWDNAHQAQIQIQQSQDFVQATRQKLNQMDRVTEEMSWHLGQIISTVGQGLETSASNSQAILGTTNLGSQNLAQFQAMADSLNKLVKVYQQAQASLVNQEHNHPHGQNNDESKLE